MRARVIALAALAAAAPAAAIVIGGTNFPIGFDYPEPRCMVPIEPFTRSERDLEQYRWDVDQYVACVNKWATNAGNDIQRIREKITEELDRARRNLR